MRLPNIRTVRLHRRFYVRFHYKGKDNKWPAGDTEQDAMLLRARITAAIGAGLFDGTRESVGLDAPKSLAARVTFGKIIDRFEDYQESRGRKSHGYISHARHIRKTFANRLGSPAASITPQEIGDYMTERYRTCRTTATANRYLATVRRIFNLAVEQGSLDRSPVRIKTEPEPSGRDFYATPEQVGELVERSPDWLAPLVYIAPRTGARQGELVSLPWSDVDFDAGRIWFRRTKNRKRHRWVPMTAAVRAYLKRLRKRHPKADYVFVDQDGNRLRSDWVRHRFARVVRAAKFYRIERGDDGADRWVWFRFHDLRHTFASWVLADVPNLKLLMKLMGHTGIQTTMRYAHLMPDAADAVALALDARADARPGKKPGKAEAQSS